MHATSNATLFHTSYSEALGAYRSRKAIHTSGLVVPSTSPTLSLDELKKRYGYPIHLHPRFEQAVINNAHQLAVQGSGADGGRYRVVSLHVHGGYVWTSESGGVVRQVDPESGKTLNIYRGAKAPIPTFDFLTTDAGETLLVTGSWDKALRVYRVSTTPDHKSCASPLIEVSDAMSDFIKSVHVFSSNNHTYIATAGSDKSIMLFDAQPLLALSPSSSSVERMLKCVHQSNAHTRPVNALASLVGFDASTRLYSADSMGRVLESTLNPHTLRLETVREIQGFSTAVYDLKAGWRRVEVEGESHTHASGHAGSDAFVSRVKEDEQGGRYKLVAEVWGASGDKTVAGYRLSPSLQPNSTDKVSSRSTSSRLLGTQDPLTTPHVRIPHRDFVKSVLPLALHLNHTHPHYHNYSEAVITASSDEHVRLFPNPTSTSQDVDVYQVEGHWHEITSLAFWIRPPLPPSNSILPSTTSNPELWIVSAGLDGSIRRWNITTIPTLPKPDLIPVSQRPNHSNLPGDWDQNSLPPVSFKPSGENAVVGKGSIQMTAEEEAELAELMSDEED